MTHYYVCTCKTNTETHDKYRVVSVGKDEECLDCGHYAIQLPKAVSKNQVGDFLHNHSKLDNTINDDYHHIRTTYKKPRWVYGWE
jgi:hypothetical protein